MNAVPRRFFPGLIFPATLAILVVTVWRLFQPAPSHDLHFTQLTFDSGLTGWPAISSDGQTVVYASDRDTGSNLELYIQPIRGGSPLRLTTTGDDNSEPDFSPDGQTIAYHSSQAGGGIYTVPAAGGGPHLLAAGGHASRYSPDGRSIAFSDASGAYIAAAAGGAPRRYHPELQSLRAPAWSPDGSRLGFWVAGDWQVAPLEGGIAESSGLAVRLAKAGLGSGPFEDARWTSSGLLFSARTGFVRNLYLCPLDSRGKAAGDIIRLTNGTELIGDAAISREGRMVFSSGRQRFDIWGLPLDAKTGKATGPPYRLTDTLAPTANPDISADGRRLLFGSSRHGFTEVWEKDLTTGTERVAASSAQGARYGRLLKSSGGVLYVQPAAGHNDVYLGARRLAGGTRPWDADSKETTVLVLGAGIDALNLVTGQRAPLLAAPEQTTLSDASFSPDDRWILFLAEKGSQSARIYVAPSHGGQWLPLTDGSTRADKPRFSPDGRLVYFISDRDGVPAIEAMNFEPQSSGAGQVFPVFRSQGLRLSLANVNRQAQEIAVARDKIIMILCESRSTIWIGDTVPH